MALRSVLVSFVVLFSTWAQASFVVPAYNKLYCPRTDILVVEAGPNDNGAMFTTFNLVGQIQKWDSQFIYAGDTKVHNNPQPLCVGLMHDHGQPNAVAVGTYYILMGLELMTMIDGYSSGVEDISESLKKFVLAHEYAHYLQNLHNLRFNFVLPMLSVKMKEQQADCMAAYLLALHDEIPDDALAPLLLFINTLADSHVVGDHGTSEQRLSAFATGESMATADLKAARGKELRLTSAQIINRCSQYFPTSK